MYTSPMIKFYINCIMDFRLYFMRSLHIALVHGNFGPHK